MASLPALPTLDLFAGPGGWDVAATRLGFDVVGIENDAATCRTRLAAGLSTIKGDVTQIDPHEIGWLDGLIASPPCKPFSKAAGSRGLTDRMLLVEMMSRMRYGQETNGFQLNDPESRLLVEPYRWALALWPRWIAIEQVPAALPVLEEMAKLLEDDQTYVCWTGIRDASDFGVPQERQRAFLLARFEWLDIKIPNQKQPRVSMSEACGWDERDMIGFPRKNRERDMRAAALPALR